MAPSRPASHQPPKKTVRLGQVWAISLVCALIAAAAGIGGTLFLQRDENQPASVVQSSPGDHSQIQSGKNTPQVTSNVTGPSTDWVAVAQQVKPTVVAIQTGIEATGEGAQGSGVIINSQEGYVVTNNHVVADADQIGVVLSDGRLFDATLLGADPSTDLAVIQLMDPPDDLVESSFGDSSQVQVGDPVMAVGNPLGLDNTVTVGIVSALNRPVRTVQVGSSVAAGEEVLTNAIQVDAAINPGNSGGPLFNRSGQVIGINSSIATISSDFMQSGSIGLGFAIPINLVSNIASQLVENGTAVHPLLGVTSDNSVTEVDGQLRAGAEIQSVSSGSPADAAGLLEGDVIYAVDSVPITGMISLTATIRSYQPGATVKLSVSRDGEGVELEATLTTREN